jgi:hypothetical protein
MRLAAEWMCDRSLQHRAGFGTAWPPNPVTPSHWVPQEYRLWKKEHYGTDEPNRRTCQMLGQQSLFGRTTIESKRVTMIDGTGQPQDRAMFGDPGEKLLERDRKVTDVEKTYFAYTDQSKQQIVRPFYQLIDDGARAIVEPCQENVNNYIRETERYNNY